MSFLLFSRRCLPSSSSSSLRVYSVFPVRCRNCFFFRAECCARKLRRRRVRDLETAKRKQHHVSFAPFPRVVYVLVVVYVYVLYVYVAHISLLKCGISVRVKYLPLKNTLVIIVIRETKSSNETENQIRLGFRRPSRARSGLFPVRVAQSVQSKRAQISSF